MEKNSSRKLKDNCKMKNVPPKDRRSTPAKVSTSSCNKMSCHCGDGGEGGGDRGKRALSQDHVHHSGRLKRQRSVVATAKPRDIREASQVEGSSTRTSTKDKPSMSAPSYSDTPKDSYNTETEDTEAIKQWMSMYFKGGALLSQSHSSGEERDLMHRSYRPSQLYPCEEDNEDEEEDGRMFKRGRPRPPGGPMNDELLTHFLGHIAYAIWSGQERNVLSSHNYVDLLKSWSIESPEALESISASKLGHLRNCMFGHLNMPLISAFVERWHPETNSFHLPFGEMTVTLHDVWYILRIPVTGKPIISGIKNIDENFTGELGLQLRMTTPQLSDVLRRRSGTMKFWIIQQQLSSGNRPLEFVARGYLLWLLGATLFVNNKQNVLDINFFPFLSDLQNVHQHAWGAAALAYLYRQLGVASRVDAFQISGCLTLLEAWIYEYFPEFRPSIREGWDVMMMPHAAKWDTSATPRTSQEALFAYRHKLNQMKADAVNWTPFGKTPHTTVPVTLYNGIIHCRTITEPYMPDRVVRQFGFCQHRPASPFRPNKLYRGRNYKKYKCEHDVMKRVWDTWQDHVMRPSDRGIYKASIPREVAVDYMDWFTERTNSRVARNGADVDHDHCVSAPNQMSDSARLEFIGSRLLQLHPLVRQHTDSASFWRCLDEVTTHLEDFMPGLDRYRIDE